MAPVEFQLGERTVSPYSLSPWMPDEVDAALPVLLKNLRGDFLCLPFGPQQEGEPHGETANGCWEKVVQADQRLVLEMQPADVGGKVTKTITLRDGETAVYVEHRIEGVTGEWSYGTHPILDLSHLAEGAGRLSVSPFRWASVYPEVFSSPADGARQALKAGAAFADLAEVPFAEGGVTDLTHYPSRAATDDLVMMVSESATPAQPFAWSACVMDGYLWFALKNPGDFPATLFWLSNGGRSAEPWKSRHCGRVGIEEVCSYFCDGVEKSRDDLLRELSIPTTREFHKDQAVRLPMIHAVAAVAGDFGAVRSIVPEGGDRVKITGEHGAEVVVAVNWKFVL